MTKPEFAFWLTMKATLSARLKSLVSVTKKAQLGGSCRWGKRRRQMGALLSDEFDGRTCDPSGRPSAAFRAGIATVGFRDAAKFFVGGASPSGGAHAPAEEVFEHATGSQTSFGVATQDVQAVRFGAVEGKYEQCAVVKLLGRLMKFKRGFVSPIYVVALRPMELVGFDDLTAVACQRS